MDRQQRAALGSRVRTAREAMNLNMKQAAALCDVPYRTYRSIENGETTAQDANLAKIMEGLQIPPLATDGDARPIWVTLHFDGIPHELELYAAVAVHELNLHLNDLLGLDEPARMAQIRRHLRDGIIGGATTG